MNSKFSLFKTEDNKKIVIQIKYETELIAEINHDKNLNGGINIHILTRYVRREDLSVLKFNLDDFIIALVQARLWLLATEP